MPRARPSHRAIGARLREARKLSAQQWGDLLRASAALGRARIALARLSPAALIEWLRADGPSEDDGRPDAATEDIIRRLDWSIAAAAGALPWRTDCLVRCLAARELLLAHGLTPEFHIGVRKTDDGALDAHAWTRCRGLPVAGGSGAEFAPLIAPGK